MLPVIYNVDMDTCSDKIKKKSIRGFYNNYFILQYKELGISFDDTKNTKYRSVVLSNPEKRLLCFSPVMSLPSYIFMKKYPIITNEILIHEYIEGVMINLFYDRRVNKWVIATKGGIGGKYGFGKDKPDKEDTFYEMFLDAIRANKYESLNNIAFLEYFSIDLSYTFILQHPKNIISISVEKPRIVLVSVFYILAQHNIAEFIPCSVYKNWQEFKNISTIIEYPKQYIFQDYKQILENDTGYGYIITNNLTGERCRIKSITGETLKQMVKIDSSTQYLYFCVRRIGKLKDFSILYSQYKKAFYTIEEEYENFISNIHDLYCKLYIYKLIDKEDIELKYFTHIYKIHHNVFLPSLKNEKKQKIYKKTVRKYFDSMEPRELLFFLSDDKRT